MKEIDWSRAPEWAKGHGMIFNKTMGMVPVWFDDDQYQYVREGGGPYPFRETQDGGVNCEKQSLRDVVIRAWDGTSLPPVGAVCEVDYCEQWHQCEVIAHFQQRVGMVAAFTVDMGDGAKALDAFGAEYFRPIRTPEQIAAEEREKAINDIAEIIGSLWSSEREAAEFLYKAGYRKTEAP